MGLKEREAESSGVINGIVSHIIPGEKYTKLEVEEPNVPAEIEMELFSQSDLKQNKKYHKISQVDEIVPEEEVSLDGAEQERDELTKEDTHESEIVVGNTQTGVWGTIQRFKERNTLKIAWGCTISGVMCTGWIAPCFKLLGSEGVTAARRASWRSQALLILLIIPAIVEYRSLTQQQKRDLFNKYTLLQLLLCGTLWFFDLFLWSNALDYTTVSRSSIFASTASLMIMVWSLVRRQPISWMEILGGVIGFLGLVFAVVGTNLFFASDAELHAKSPLKGDILSIASAGCVAAYVLNATKVRAKVSVFIYTTSNTCLLFFALSGASFIMEGTKFDMSTDGLFGWIEPRFMLIVGLLSVVAGLIGFNLNNVALRYMPPLGYTLVALCDPFISGTYAWMIGADGIPGIFTFMGGVITISGIVVLVIGQEKRKKKEKQASEEKAIPKVLEFVVSDGTEV
eukprot:Phypoly_transcript_08191.p1 GENE.Phypoly_transcript_08191~~Phypoly_transcript_08191.p1  ORF type:complete len:455 (-),score=68.26 Phypoly_transcript_08191:81-1445(-)